MNNIKNNKGVSIMEVLIVLAIIAMLGTLSTITMSVVTNANLSRAATNLQSAISSARAQSMARGSDNGFIHVFTSGNSVVYTIGSDPEQVRLCNGLVKVVVEDVDVKTETYSTSFVSPDFYIYFDSAGMVKPAPDGSSPSSEIVFCRGNRRTGLFLHKLTGKSETFTYYTL